jgi:hypothetical protein
MEKVLADHLQDISGQMHDNCRILTHYVPYLPCRIYIEAPGIVKIQEIMKFSTYGHLLISRTTRILDDNNRKFLHSNSIPELPCRRTWVRIIQPGIYKGDLAIILLAPREGPSDIVTIAIVPRFTNSKNKKRRGSNRPAPALLDLQLMENFPSGQNNTTPTPL